MDCRSSGKVRLTVHDSEVLWAPGSLKSPAMSPGLLVMKYSFPRRPGTWRVWGFGLWPPTPTALLGGGGGLGTTRRVRRGGAFGGPRLRCCRGVSGVQRCGPFMPDRPGLRVSQLLLWLLAAKHELIGEVPRAEASLMRAHGLLVDPKNPRVKERAENDGVCAVVEAVRCSDKAGGPSVSLGAGQSSSIRQHHRPPRERAGEAACRAKQRKSALKTTTRLHPPAPTAR